MEEKEDVSRLRARFLSYAAERSGRLGRDDFTSLCTELRVSPAEVENIFRRLDRDRDGSITFEDFVMGFRGTQGLQVAEETRELPGGEARRSPRLSEGEVLEEENCSPAWKDFTLRLGEEANYMPRKEQASILYQNITIVEPLLIQQYEHVIRNFVREIRLQSTEMENLAIAVKRAQDKAAMQLSELEEEMDHRIQAAENRIKKEEKRKAEEALNDLKRQHETEVAELQVAIKKLKKLEEQSKNISLKEDVAALKKRLHELTMENQKLKKDLLEAQTSISFLQSELDALKSDYADQSLTSERDMEIIREYTDERENLARQIEILQTANRKLHDSNDGLRTVLENSLIKYNRSLRVNTSPGNTISRQSPKLNRSNSPYDRSPRSSFLDEDYDSLAVCDPMQRMNYEVDSLPESCIDSGLSTLRDSNEYDSEVEYRPPRSLKRSRFAHEGYGGDASDTDVPEIRDEESYAPESGGSYLDWKPSRPVSRSSSGASSRKCISALPAHVTNAETAANRVSKFPSTEKAYKIVLAGDAAVGKSSFLMRLCKNEFRGNTSATLGVDFQMKTLVVDGEPALLQLWDTAGQERFRSIAKSYFRRADGVLLLYDVTCEKSFLNVREWIDMIEDSTNDSIPIMMVGNKADLRQTLSEQGHKCVPTSYGEKLSMTYGALFCETSAKEGSNIVEAVLHLAREVRKRSDNEDDRGSVTNLSGAITKKPTQMKNCCNV
ncbi:ras and EF-hand domain-containing protein [Dendropsophus ebraccatus]|uniref:ras and EF-hand domain-containing protein n=1 Tax=Dendropsophus ebraccatus TaxID=150705 RepID=UPI0038310F47